MYINDRDQINYHGFLKALREMQGAGLRMVAEGICSDSEVYRTEIGDRLPEKLMRDRITSRLGVSGEEYEEYLRPEEYRQWQIRMHILESINKEDLDSVKQGMEEYSEIKDRNPVQEQFLDAMQYMYAQMCGYSDDLLRAMIELAVVRTIPDVESAFRGGHLLADQELNLIAEYTKRREYHGEGESEYEWRLSTYYNILEYVDRSYMDMIGRSKIYPRTTCLICELVLNHGVEQSEVEHALEMCTKSIELLRDTSRLYYFVELLEYRKKLIERLLVHTSDDERKAELKAMAEKDAEWEILLKELYKEYGVPVYMQNFTYLYVETECNNAVEVIRTRRTMLKMSRLKVSDNICAEKTVERFENYANSPSIAIVRDIFERIGLCAEYKRARVVTDNAEMFSVYKRLIEDINDFKTEEAKKELNLLKAGLHMDIAYNKQELKRVANLINMRNNVLDKNDFYKNTVEALECTLPIWALLKNKNSYGIYLTRAELSCIYDIAFKTDGDFKYRTIEILEDICMEFLNFENNPCKLSVYELIICVMASDLGDAGDYHNSNKMGRKMLIESLRHRRMNVLSDVLYNNLWNYQNEIRNVEIDNDIVRSMLRKCNLLCEVQRKTNWMIFFQKKLMELGE